jgi:hypothetical protein
MDDVQVGPSQDKCTRSVWVFNLNDFTPRKVKKYPDAGVHLFRDGTISILNLYFGTHMMWYCAYQVACDCFGN